MFIIVLLLITVSVVRIRLLDYRGNELGSESMPLLHGVTEGQMAKAIQQSVEIRFPTECRNCTLLIEKINIHNNANNSNLERSCAEVDISDSASMYRFLIKNCFGNGIWEDEVSSGRCVCSHGFSGQYCQHKDDCADDLECGPNGKCITNGIMRGHKSCFCQFGFFGTNCERNQNCFRHVGPSPVAEANGNLRYGLFNPDCYSSKTLNEEETEEDRLHWRLVGNQLELILDFCTSNLHNWIGIGWRPLQIPLSCRLFPQIISSLEQKLAKTSGLSREWLEQPLNPMECADMIMGSIREGNLLHIEDLYSRDMSSPLRDSLLDGEESLSAAYGLQTGNRTLLMFRRLISEIEPTDHPLGPGNIFVLYAKGQLGIGRDGNLEKLDDQQWKYHGSESTNRGHLEIEFVKQSQMNQIRVPLIHFDHLPDNGHNNEVKELKEKDIKPETGQLLKTNYTNSSNLSPFIANEHIVVDIPTAIFATNSQEFERQNEDGIKENTSDNQDYEENKVSSTERDKEDHDGNDKQSKTSSSLPLRSKIFRILALTFLMANLIIYII
uniref:EGF-like domain-containing protein n=2 Tax=Meloidogyne hapla TaxID=6305 RepID=A0A1I8BN16_MELHA